MNNNGFNRLDKKPAHRKAMLRNMSDSFFAKEKIVSSLAKVKELRRVVEKIITRAKKDTLHNRREIKNKIRHLGIVHKLFENIGPRFLERPGGYTRIIKLNYRRGDASPRAQLSLVDYDDSQVVRVKNKKITQRSSSSDHKKQQFKEKSLQNTPAKRSLFSSKVRKSSGTRGK